MRTFSFNEVVSTFSQSPRDLPYLLFYTRDEFESAFLWYMKNLIDLAPKLAVHPTLAAAVEKMDKSTSTVRSFTVRSLLTH